MEKIDIMMFDDVIEISDESELSVEALGSVASPNSPVVDELKVSIVETNEIDQQKVSTPEVSKEIENTKEDVKSIDLNQMFLMLSEQMARANADTNAKIAEFGVETNAKIAEFGVETNAKIAESSEQMARANAETNAKIAESSEHLKAGMASIKSELSELTEKIDRSVTELSEKFKVEIISLKTELSENKEEFKLEIASIKSEMVKTNIETKVELKSEICKNTVESSRNFKVEMVNVKTELLEKIEKNASESSEKIHNFKEEVNSIKEKVEIVENSLAEAAKKIEVKVEQSIDDSIGRIKVENEKDQEKIRLSVDEVQVNIQNIREKCEKMELVMTNKNVSVIEKVEKLHGEVNLELEKVKEENKKYRTDVWSDSDFEVKVQDVCKKMNYFKFDPGYTIKDVESKTEVLTNSLYNHDSRLELLSPNETLVKSIESGRAKISKRKQFEEVLNDNMNNASSLAFRFISIKPFRGESTENPIEYLNSLEELFALWEATEKEKLAIACNHLYAGAKEWWQSLFNKPLTYGDFKYLMLSSFWGNETQDSIRYQISIEKYSPNKGSYTKFFRGQAVKLKMLTAFPLSENQIVRILRHNLPKSVEQILIASNHFTIDGVMETLKALELTEQDSENRSKFVKNRNDYGLNNISISDDGFNRPMKKKKGPPPRLRNTPYYNPQYQTKTEISNGSDQPSTSGITTIMKKDKGKSYPEKIQNAKKDSQVPWFDPTYGDSMVDEELINSL